MDLFWNLEYVPFELMIADKIYIQQKIDRKIAKVATRD